MRARVGVAMFVTLVLLFLVVGCGGGGAGGATAPAPVGWWRGEGNTVDSAGGNHGTTYGGVTYGPGIQGQAFDFSGVDGEIAIPDAPALAITRSLTLDAWIWVTALPSQAQGGAIIVGRMDSDDISDPYFMFIDAAGGIGFHIGTALDAEHRVGRDADLRSSPIAVNQWVHLTATLDDSTGAMRLYINGVLAAQTTTDVRPLGPLDPAANPGVGIGNHAGFPTQVYRTPFNGKIDEVRIYNKVVPPSS